MWANDLCRISHAWIKPVIAGEKKKSTAEWDKNEKNSYTVRRNPIADNLDTTFLKGSVPGENSIPSSFAEWKEKQKVAPFNLFNIEKKNGARYRYVIWRWKKKGKDGGSLSFTKEESPWGTQGRAYRVEGMRKRGIPSISICTTAKICIAPENILSGSLAQGPCNEVTTLWGRTLFRKKLRVIFYRVFINKLDHNVWLNWKGPVNLVSTKVTRYTHHSTEFR